MFLLVLVSVGGYSLIWKDGLFTCEKSVSDHGSFEWTDPQVGSLASYVYWSFYLFVVKLTKT